MGIDRDRFIDRETCETFVCPTCKDIIDNPVATNCCDQVFCTTCINLVFGQTSSCPHCRGETGRQTKPLQRQLKELYLKLRLRCSQPTCKVKLTVENYKSHDTSCPKIPWSCNECGLDGNISQKDDHHCLSWLTSERERLMKELDDAHIKIASLETQLTSDFEDRANLQAQLADMEAIHDQVTEESSQKIKALNDELEKYKQRVVEAECQRDELLLEISSDDGGKSNGAIGNSTVPGNACGGDHEPAASVISGSASSSRKSSTASSSLTTERLMELLSRPNGNSNSHQTRVMGMARQRKPSTDSLSSFLSRRETQTEEEEDSLANFSSMRRNPSQKRKELRFLKDTRATDIDLKEQVTKAVMTSDAKKPGQGIQSFVLNVKDILEKMNGGIWHCFPADRFVANKVKFVESTFCSVLFDGRQYFIFRDQRKDLRLRNIGDDD